MGEPAQGPIRELLRSRARAFPIAIRISRHEWPLRFAAKPASPQTSAGQTAADRKGNVSKFPEIRLPRRRSDVRMEVALHCSAPRPPDPAARLDLLAIRRTPFRHKPAR